MPRTVRLTHHYPVSAEQLWSFVIDLDRLAQVMRKTMTFRNLPSGQIRAGQSFDVQVSLFGKLPWQPYHMKVVELDHDAMTFLSDEKGAGVKSWRHRLWVKPHETGAMIIEEIEIDAGLMTPVFALWARFMYAARHKPRLQALTS